MPPRLACARCPFYIRKRSTRGQLLNVKDGIDHMLERLDLTDDERAALEGDREAVTALAERLADTPTQAGPPPENSARPTASFPLTQLMDTVPAKAPPSLESPDSPAPGAIPTRKDAVSAAAPPPPAPDPPASGLGPGQADDATSSAMAYSLTLRCWETSRNTSQPSSGGSCHTAISTPMA